MIERPPIRGKDLRPFASSQLDHAFRLHPGPLPQEYSSLFAAAPVIKQIQRNNHHNQPQAQLLSSSGMGSGSRLPATAAPNLISSGNSNQRKRRYEVHRGSGGSRIGSSLVNSTTSNGSVSFFATPPTVFTQLGLTHNSGGSNSSLPSIYSCQGSFTNSVMSSTSVQSYSNNNILDSPGKPGDLPPGLIPVSTAAMSNTPFVSDVPPPPPPPLLAPIHHNVSQRPAGIGSTSVNAHLNYNSDFDVLNSNTGLENSLCKSSPISIPPLLQSIHTPNTFFGSSQSNIYVSRPYLSSAGRLLSPNTSSPVSPDLFNKMKHSNLSEDKRPRKKRREKKRRKEKD